MRRLILPLLLLLTLTVPAWTFPFHPNGGVAVTASQTIASVGPSTGSFTGGAADGTVAATMATVMSPSSPGFSGTYTLSTSIDICNGTNGAQNADFKIPLGTNTVELNGTQPGGTYLACVAAQQSGVAPKAVAMTITGSGLSMPTVVQSVNGTSGCAVANSSSCSATLASGVSAGNSVLLKFFNCGLTGSFSCGTSGSYVLSATDSANDACSLVSGTDSGLANGARTEFFYCPTVTPGTTTFTVSSPTNLDWLNLSPIEIAGGLGGPEAGNSNSTNSGSTLACGNTTATANDLLFAGTYPAGGPTVSLGSPWSATSAFNLWDQPGTSPGAYNAPFSWGTTTVSACSFVAIQPTPPSTIASVGPSAATFTANQASGVIEPVSVTMFPSYPPSTAALTLSPSGGGSGGFQLSGTGCTNISLGTCNLEQSSGGTAPGTYTDVSLMATQAGISNSPQTQPLTLTGSAQTIASVGPTGASFTVGNPSGTSIATLATVMSPASPAFTGTYAASTTLGTCNGTNGANNADFAVNSSTGVVTLASGSLTAGTYKACFVASGSYSNSPQSVAMTVTGSPPGFTFVQKAISPGCANPGTTCSVTLTGTQVGDLLIAGFSYCNANSCGFANPNSVPTGISDTHGNTCALIPGTLVGSDNDNQPATGVGYCQNNNSAGNDTITVTWNSSGGFGAPYYNTVSASEWAGALANNPVDMASGASASGSINSFGISVGTSVANDLVLSVGASTGTGPTANQTPLNSIDEYQISGAVGSYTNSWTATGAVGYSTSIVAFAPASGVQVSITPPATNFTPNVPNGYVATVTAPMVPPSQTFVGSMAITGANSGGFHLTSCSGNTCVLEEASSGGTAAGSYADFNVVPTQAGVSNSGQAFPITAVGAAPPADTQTVADASGSGATNYPLQEGHPSILGEFPAGTCIQATYAGSPIETQADITNTWPDGSIKMAVLSMVLPTIPAGTPGANQTLSFAPTTSGSRSTSHCYSVAGVAADSTPLTVSQMENAAYNFDSQITMVGKGGSPTVTRSAYTMLNTAGTCSATDPWTSRSPCRVFYYGPVMQTIGLWANAETTTCGATSNAASTYDIGFGDGFCPIRPMFYATFWPTTPSHQVQIRFVAESGLFNAYEDASYVATLTAGKTSPSTVFGPYDLTGTGNGIGQGITGISVNQTVNSSYTGTLAITGTPSSSITVGSGAYWVDQNTDEWFYATYTSTTQLTIPASCGFSTNFGCRGFDGQGFGQNLTAGDPLVEAFPVKQHWVGSAWTQQYWINGAPNQAVNINQNMTYLEWTHYIPNYDPSITIQQATLQGTGCWTNGDTDQGSGYGYVGWWTCYGSTPGPYDGWWDGVGPIANPQENQGARWEISPEPTYDTWWVNTGDWRMRLVSTQMANIAASFAWHMTATDPASKILRTDSPGTGLGFPNSRQGYGGMSTAQQYGAWTTFGLPAGAASLPTLTAGGFNGAAPFTYQITVSHSGDFYYIPYIMTGDPWYLRESGLSTTFYAGQDGNPYNTGDGGMGPLDVGGAYTSYSGVTYNLWEPRWTGWGLRNRSDTALAWPDGDAQQPYFLSLENDALASMAGAYRLPSSPYAGSTMYSWASGVGSAGNISAGGSTVTSPLGFAGSNNNVNYYGGECSVSTAVNAQEMFMLDFVSTGTGMSADKGFPDDVNEFLGGFLSGVINNTSYPKLAAINWGITAADSSNTWFSTWAAYNANMSGAPEMNDYYTNPSTTSSCNTDGQGLIQQFKGGVGASGYPGQGQAPRASLVDEGAPGAVSAWTWWNTNVNQPNITAGTSGGWLSNNSFDFVPRPAGNAGQLPPPTGWSPSLQ